MKNFFLGCLVVVFVIGAQGYLHTHPLPGPLVPIADGRAPVVTAHLSDSRVEAPMPEAPQTQNVDALLRDAGSDAQATFEPPVPGAAMLAGSPQVATPSTEVAAVSAASVVWSAAPPAPPEPSAFVPVGHDETYPQTAPAGGNAAAVAGDSPDAAGRVAPPTAGTGSTWQSFAPAPASANSAQPDAPVNPTELALVPRAAALPPPPPPARPAAWFELRDASDRVIGHRGVLGPGESITLVPREAVQTILIVVGTEVRGSTASLQIIYGSRSRNLSTNKNGGEPFTVAPLPLNTAVTITNQ